MYVDIHERNVRNVMAKITGQIRRKVEQRKPIEETDLGFFSLMSPLLLLSRCVMDRQRHKEDGRERMYSEGKTDTEGKGHNCLRKKPAAHNQ